MKIAIGFYTELSESSPVPIFDRALTLIYEPILSFLYNSKKDKSIFFYQGASMTRYIRENRPEYRTLLSTLAKRGKLSFLTGSFSQAILSVLPLKERANQIERMTAYIKREYGILPDTAFFYGQVWSPSYISALKTCRIDNIICSSYKATNKENFETESFTMNELGKKEGVYITSDPISSIISSFQQGEINLEQVEEQIDKVILEYIAPEMVIFINIDQLLEGVSRTTAGDSLREFLTRLLNKVEPELVNLEEINKKRPGYLEASWYGRDAYALGLKSFNDNFVRNSNYRYLLNRYTSLYEIQLNDRELKKDVNKILFSIETGPLFIYDAQCTPLRESARQLFWSQIIEAENLIWDVTESSSYRMYDLEGFGGENYYLSGNNYLAVLSSRGGSVTEFDYRKGRFNLFDNRAEFDKNFLRGKLYKSFTERITLNGRSYLTEERMFEAEVLNRKYTDVEFSLFDDSMPVSLCKRYKMRNSTFLMDLDIRNNNKEDLKGKLEVFVYLGSQETELSSPEQKISILQNKLVEARTVRYILKSRKTVLNFTSTKSFRLSEKEVNQPQFTSLGLEVFNLYKMLSFTFDVDLAPEASDTYRLAIRLGEKEKERE